jgi:Chaperone of endosialidase
VGVAAFLAVGIAAEITVSRKRMEREVHMQRFFTLVVIVMMAWSVSTARALSDTSFAYQGRLLENGVPASGFQTFRVTIWDSLTDGNQIGGVQISSTEVSADGLFVLNINVTNLSDLVNDQMRWIEIVVNGETLSPRQRVLGSPYSIQTRGIVVDNDGNVGVGTSAPAAQLHAETGDDFSAITAINSAQTGTSYAIIAESASSSGIGILAQSTATSGSTNAIRAEDNSANGVGVFGLSLNQSGSGYGVRGTSTGLFGRAVFGWASSTTGSNRGIYGKTNSPNGYAGYFEGGQNYFQGSVGVGTTSPGNYGFVIKESLTSSGRGLRILNAEESRSVQLWVGTGGAVLDAQGLTNLQFRTNAIDRLHIQNSTGNVGIGVTDAGFKLEVNGSAGKPGGGSWSNSSDRRLKKNIHTLEGSLDRLMRLRGVRFEYKDPEAIYELPGVRMGMIAQEVEEVFPDWVETGTRGYKTLTFRGFEALTVESFRELRREKDAEVALLQTELASMRDENNALRDRLGRVERLMLEVVDRETSR